MVDFGTAVSTREKLILAGLYLSKYDLLGLATLGFENFQEAFNVIGLALASKPASVKNYRDEFDPLFPNPRSGWHKRQTRANCAAVLERFGSLDFAIFTGLVKAFFDYDGRGDPEAAAKEDSASSFAQRMITGLAAEKYFESAQKTVPEFASCTLENTTRLGCGYDYRLHHESRGSNFLAVEVKGLRGPTGNVSLDIEGVRGGGRASGTLLLVRGKKFPGIPQA